MNNNDDLSMPVRPISESNTYVPHETPIIGTNRTHPEYTDNGALTFWGVYNLIILPLQNDRQWARSTCLNYDAIVSTYLAPAFGKLDFSLLNEDNFVAIWNNLRSEIDSEQKKTTCCRMLRLIVDYAQRYNYTYVTLWGIPDLQDGVTDDMLDDIFLTSPELEDVAQHNVREKEGLSMAKKGVRIARAMPLATEFRFAKLLLSLLDRFGELFAALFIWIAGLRPSEAAALNFGHLGKTNGRWGVAVYQVSEQHSRETHDGGKSGNAPRIIPLPKFFSSLLEARKAMLEQLYPDQDICTFPIACRGNDHKTRCTTDEVNGRLKTVFHTAGVAESMIAAAYESMRDSPEIAEDCEKRVVAYLLRHQFATACKYCGLTDDECSAMMGHKLGTPGVLKTDFVNPDMFLELAQKLDQRPIVALLDKQSSNETITFFDDPLDIYTKVPTDIIFAKDTHFDLTVFTQTINTDVLFTADDRISITSMGTPSVPETFSPDSNSIAFYLYQYSNTYARFFLDNSVEASEVIAASKSNAVMDNPDLLAVLSASPLSAMQTPIEKASTVTDLFFCEDSPICPTRVDPSIDMSNAGSNTADPIPSSVSLLRPRMVAQNPHSVYAIDNTGKICAISPDAHIVRPRSRRGVKLCPDHGPAQIKQLLIHDRNLPSYILTIDGALYVLPPMVVLDSEDFHSTYKICCDVLSGGAVFFQMPKYYDEPSAQPTIVAVNNTGKIVRIRLPSKPTPPQSPISLINVDVNSHITSACICSESEDVLIVSAHGKALHLASDNLRTRKTYGVDMIHGITLSDKDQVVTCMPYEHSAQYLATTTNGMLIHLSPLQLLAHKRGSQGVALVRLYDTDTVVSLTKARSATLLATSDGYSLCVNMGEITPLGKGAKGVQGITATRGHVIGALPLDLSDSFLT